MTDSIRPGRQLDGKVALVTGGSRGIGAAVVKRLAADGAIVAFTYSASPGRAAEVVKAVEAAGGKARAIAADARDAAAVKSAVAETVEAFGGLDILVNSAGIFVYRSIQDITLEDYEWVMDVNVKGTFVAVQAAIPHMTEGGRIINIGSANSHYIPYAGGALYGMSKAAVSGLTKALSRDLGPLGITINNVMPGPTNTDMNPADDEGAPTIAANTALNRFAHPDEIADFIAYVASPGSSFMTGSNLLIDGGYTA